MEAATQWSALLTGWTESDGATLEPDTTDSTGRPHIPTELFASCRRFKNRRCHADDHGCCLKENTVTSTQVEPELVVPTRDAAVLERRGRRWLIWSFVFCPCHLPVTMAVLAAIFGGSAFGALVSRNTLAVGIIFGLIYAAGVGVGFYHLRQAAAGRDCAAGSCEI